MTFSPSIPLWNNSLIPVLRTSYAEDPLTELDRVERLASSAAEFAAEYDPDQRTALKTRMLAAAGALASEAAKL